MNKVDADCANVTFFCDAEAERASRGLAGNETVRLAPRTKLYRVGHYKIDGLVVNETDNYRSPWWMLETDFMTIMNHGQRDPAWAARVSLAMAEIWGGDCTREISAFVRKPLGAWKGIGKAITKGSRLLGVAAKAIDATHRDAYWVPDPSIVQYYIPGLSGIPAGDAAGLWATALENRMNNPLLVAGFNNIDQSTGARFKTRLNFKHDHFGDSLRK